MGEDQRQAYVLELRLILFEVKGVSTPKVSLQLFRVEEGSLATPYPIAVQAECDFRSIQEPDLAVLAFSSSNEDVVTVGSFGGK